MKPDYIKKSWDKFIEEEPFGYIFEFKICQNELLPDEDAIGAGISSFLNKKENGFYEKYLKDIDKNLLKEVKNGSFIAFSNIGKIIEPKLKKEDLKIIIKNSSTGTVDKIIYHNNLYKIKKPQNKFLSKKEKFIEYFNKCQKF